MAANSKEASLKHQIESLRLENKGLRMMIESKRYQLADKLGGTFNRLAPKGTRRNQAAHAAYSQLTKIQKANHRRRLRPIARNIIELAGSKPIIIYDTIPYHAVLKQRPQHLAIELGKLGYFILWLERAGSSEYHKINDRIVAVRSADIMSLLNGLDNPIYFFASSTANLETTETVLHALPTAKLMFEYIDEIDGDISGHGAYELLGLWKKLPDLKPMLLLASARKLRQELLARGFDKKNVLLSPNATNVEHFDFTKHLNHKPPKDLAPIVAKKQPIIGFYGAVAPWLDYSLLNNIAKHNPQLSFVYIGTDYNHALKHLEQIDNVHFLGEKKYDKLADYSYHFDVAIIPFKHGEIAKATSPVKLFEYMAMGLPTVCTRDLRECSGYDYVLMSSNEKDFENNIKLAIKVKQDHNARLRLLEQAKQNTWAQRASDIHAFLDNHQRSNKSS